ncbi:protein YLS3-like [Vitis riparia]|uniref:protein YLS3-like n=1 Tax=Vitis riparia TaxID=96939 RepID=UPI00155A29A7|nr:protein YLS3-like [Vitis riparia]
MEVFKSSMCLVSTLAIALMVVIMPVQGQISTSCSASMISSFTPCINFVTNSSGNGTSPTADCCNALRSLTSTSMDCFCLIVTGSVPFQIPINRTLAISLPRACNMASVPVQCKATGAPVPAPGPAALGPTLSPTGPSPKASSVPESTSPALAPESDTTPSLTPDSPTADSDAPTTTTGSRPVLTPSAGNRPQSLSPSLVLFVLGIIFIKYY